MNRVVYEFHEPREFLAHVLKEKQQKNPRFSLRSWCKQVGLSSPSTLSMVLRGERKLQLEMIGKISESLSLPAEEKRYLEVLTLLVNSQTHVERELYSDLLSKIRPGGGVQLVELDKFRLIADWYHPVIYEMTELKDFNSDPKWISDRLGGSISPISASEAVDRLTRLGLLERTQDGALRKSMRSTVTTTDDVPNQAIKRFHKQMIEKALEALKSQAVEEREISSITIPVSKDTIESVKRKIREFQTELADAFGNSGADEVYQLNFQLFRLTEGERK